MIPRFPAQQLGWKFQYLKWRSKEEDQVGATGTILVPLLLLLTVRSGFKHTHQLKCMKTRVDEQLLTCLLLSPKIYFYAQLFFPGKTYIIEY